MRRAFEKDLRARDEGGYFLPEGTGAAERPIDGDALPLRPDTAGEPVPREDVVVAQDLGEGVQGPIQSFPGAPDFLRSHGVEVVDLDLPECVEMMEKFIAENPALWNEDIGR